jgi:hypothetical protein
MPRKADTFIEIKEGHIKYQYRAYHRIEENGMYSWYIPSFQMFYSSKTKEEGDQRTEAMAQSFFSFWFEKEKSFRGFIHEIHHFGFRASQHNLTVNKLLTHKINHAEFGYANGHASEEFKNSISELKETRLVVAI